MLDKQIPTNKTPVSRTTTSRSWFIGAVQSLPPFFSESQGASCTTKTHFIGPPYKTTRRSRRESVGVMILGVARAPACYVVDINSSVRCLRATHGDSVRVVLVRLRPLVTCARGNSNDGHTFRVGVSMGGARRGVSRKFGIRGFS